MTLAEIRREVLSKQRVEKRKAREKASFDYILADLIGRSVGRLYSKSTKMPELYEVYPSLFEEQDIKDKRQEKQAELSALRFRRFAASYNKKYEGGGEN